MDFLKIIEENGVKKLKVTYKNCSIEVPVSIVTNNRKVVLTDQEFEKKPMVISHIDINGKRIYLCIDKNGVLHTNWTISHIYRMKFNLKVNITKKNIVFWGLLTNKNTSKEYFDNVYFNDELVTKVKRISKRWKFKQIAIIKIPVEKLLKSTEYHNVVRVGKSPDISFSLMIKRRNSNKMNYYAKRIIGSKLLLVRSTVNFADIRLTISDANPEYFAKNIIKNNIARLLAKIIGKKDIVLLFEKETKRAEESGYYVFEKIIDKKLNKTKAYFIIDKNSKDYKKIKEKHGKYIVEKYSFRHYLYIYLSKYFISSELSNHVMNTRLYITSLNEEIKKKPLIFLQHGIMFAKPVDNPAAEAFHKGKTLLNIYKNVISSDLEATQFYKMGYEDSDLIKCGLTKFDSSYMNEDADKILFMQTYRYWEEGKINNDELITETTYYKSYMDVIHAFEKANMLDKLKVSCHPKFAECLVKAAPEYAKIIEPDLTKALAEAKVFITDYSSASYDAHYRGAYIIYYWADKDYLIEQYKAIPPINETNCDGVPVYSPEELVKEVQNAIDKNYIMDEKYEENYRKINEFHDGKNGERLINELIKLKILK